MRKTNFISRQFELLAQEATEWKKFFGPENSCFQDLRRLSPIALIISSNQTALKSFLRSLEKGDVIVTLELNYHGEAKVIKSHYHIISTPRAEDKCEFFLRNLRKMMQLNC